VLDASSQAIGVVNRTSVANILQAEQK
jgi:hypothetical protein